MQQPRQSRTQGFPRGAGRPSSSRLSTSSAAADDDIDGLARAAGAAKAKAAAATVPLLQPMLPKAPARWKGPVGKLIAAKAFAGSALPDDRVKEELTKKQSEDGVTLHWYVGYIYAGFGIFDMFARVFGVILWKIRFDTFDTPRVSDTQRFEIEGDVVKPLDLWRLVIVGAAAVLRCIVNMIVLWPSSAHLRPSWMVRGAGTNKKLLMRLYCPIFRGVLVLWCLTDLLQACTPDHRYDPTEKGVLTAHVVFQQLTWFSCGFANIFLLVTLFHDRDAGDIFVAAGLFSLAVFYTSLIYYDVALFRKQTGKCTPMGWALVVETSALMFNVGLGLPTQILAVPGSSKQRRWMVKFIRLGKVRPGEDTSARTGTKPLLACKEDTSLVCPSCGNLCSRDSIFCRKCGNKIDDEADGDAEAKPKEDSVAEDELLKSQRAELAELNATIKTKTGGYRRGRKAKTADAAAAPEASTGQPPEASESQKKEEGEALEPVPDPYAP